MTALAALSNAIHRFRIQVTKNPDGNGIQVTGDVQSSIASKRATGMLTPDHVECHRRPSRVRSFVDRRPSAPPMPAAPGHARDIARPVACPAPRPAQVRPPNFLSANSLGKGAVGASLALSKNCEDMRHNSLEALRYAKETGKLSRERHDELAKQVSTTFAGPTRPVLGALGYLFGGGQFADRERLYHDIERETGIDMPNQQY